MALVRENLEFGSVRRQSTMLVGGSVALNEVQRICRISTRKTACGRRFAWA